MNDGLMSIILHLNIFFKIEVHFDDQKRIIHIKLTKNCVNEELCTLDDYPDTWGNA